MTKLDNSDGDGGENVELEALKALAYEGEPHEIAENFKNKVTIYTKLRDFVTPESYTAKVLMLNVK